MSKKKIIVKAFLTAFCVFLSATASCLVEAVETERDVLKQECVVGRTQNKYIADENGCGYATSTRTCCSGGTWSMWDKECETCEETNPCKSDSDCCNGNSCVNTGKGYTLIGSEYWVCGKKCSASKPSCSLNGGTCEYECNCDASTGEWANCTKNQYCKAGYNTITYADGRICCEDENCGKANASGFISQCLCSGGNMTWSFIGAAPCGSVSLGNKGKGPDDACGACTDKNIGAECITGDPEGEGDSCTRYICEGIKS